MCASASERAKYILLLVCTVVMREMFVTLRTQRLLKFKTRLDLLIAIIIAVDTYKVQIIGSV